MDNFTQHRKTASKQRIVWKKSIYPLFLWITLLKRDGKKPESRSNQGKLRPCPFFWQKHYL